MECMLNGIDICWHRYKYSWFAGILAGKMGELGCDLDKVCLQLEAKEFTVEASTLQSLQQLIQWVSDLALFLIATAPTVQQTRGPTVSAPLSVFPCN